MKRFLLFAAAVLSGFALSAVSANAQASKSVLKEARVTQVVKDVKLLAGQAEPRPATLSDSVRGDTAVRTGAGSRAELTFADLTIARLGANTIFSFNEGTRTVDLGNGAILLRVPKGSGGAKVQTAAVTAAITGTTVIVEYHPKSYAKYLVLEGTMRIYLKGILGESLLLTAGQMMILNPNATRLSAPVDFDLERLLKTSLFIQGFRPLESEPLMANVQQTQLVQKAAGELIDTNLVIFGRGTLITLTDPQSLDVIDLKTASVTLPTPTPTATPAPTPTATPTATPRPTPSKFGTPPPIVTFVPYPIDNGTTLQTDPAVTRAGVTDFGKIYRDATQDGPFSAWAFTATSPFDNTAGIDTLYGGNVPVAAFKFAALQLVGNPTISTANGGAINLALISVGPITAAPSGNTAFTFTGMQSVLIATQNGSIDTSGPDITFQNIPLLVFYARGAGSNLTLGGMGVFGVTTLRLLAENNIQINAPESLTNGANGGTLRGIAGGSLAVNSPVDTQTASVGPGVFSGAGGSVSLSAVGGPVTVGSRIQTSYNTAVGVSGSRSASGGSIGLDSGLTTGTGISLTPNASLLSLLNPAALGPGGSITLSTPGSDIVSNGPTIQADRGTITIQQSAAASVGTGQITLNGGTITSETLLASSRGDLTIGTTNPINLFAVTLSLLANGNLAWSGGTFSAAAGNSSGNVTVQAGNDISLTGALVIQRSNGGITNGLNLSINAGRNLTTNGGLNLMTDGSGLTSGANITLNSGNVMTIGGAGILQTGPTTGNEGTGSNISITAGGAITVVDLFGTVQTGAGRTLSNGGNLGLTGTSYAATLADGGLNFQVNNSAPGIIGSGGNITLNLTGGLTTGRSGALNLVVNNSNGGQIQTGGNIASSIGGNLTTDQVTVQIDNRFKGFIGNGAAMNFTVGGTTTINSGAFFTILNSQSGTGSTIGSDATIKLTLANTNIGGSLNSFIDNVDGSIGGVGGTVTLQINGTLAVTGRIDVFGTLNATGAITAGTLSATNVNAPSITVGAGGITRFTFPNEITVNPLHTITTNALTSTGGINFNGPDFNTPAGFGPFDGGQLTLNVPSLTFGPSAADNIQGPVAFDGGASSSNAIPAGNGGTFTVNATGAITVGSPIEATTGLQPSAAEASGAGGTVNLNSTGGAITVNSAITVSSADAVGPAPPPPRRRSASGGNINLQSNAATGVAINVSSTGQLLSLLDAAAPGPGGKITILATGANSGITVTGPAAAGAPVDSIRADRGSIDIRHTGLNGTIDLTNSNILADIVKVGALGDNGVLTIGGGVINANTVLKLYAIGSNGAVDFISNVTLNGNSMKIIAGNSVTVNNNVIVTIGGGKPADVYVLDPTKANYSNASGGNNSTNGIFTRTSPGDGAITHLGVAPPAFGPPGGP